MCEFVGHGLRSTCFVLGVAKKSEVRIYSARTSLTYPSSFCQASTRATAGDPWLWQIDKLQRNKHELPVNTPSPNTHRFFVLQICQISPLHSEQRLSFFFNCTCTCLSSAILLAIVARQSLSLFFKQKITGQTEFVFKHTWSTWEYFKIPQDSHCRATPFLAFSIGSLATAANHGCTCAILCYSPFKAEYCVFSSP